MWLFFHQSPICIIQPLLHPAHYDFVHSLHLLVSLEVGRSGILVCDPKVVAVFPEAFTIKLETVVRDEGVRGSEAHNDIFPNEFLGIHVPNVGQRFSLYPFGEIIGADYYVSLIPYCF